MIDLPGAAPQRRRGGRALAFQAVIIMAALLLIAVTAIFTLISIDTETREARGRADGSVANLAIAVEWQLNRQLQAIDQTLQVLADDWKADPIRFDPNAWRKRSTLIGDVSLQVFLLDTQGFVMSSTRSDLMGLDQSERDYFLAARNLRNKGLFVGPAIRWQATGRWEINLSRRLERSDGSFAGAIVVSYDPWALTSLLEQVDLGPRGLIALVGGDGAIRALVSPGAVRPGEDISTSAMYRAMLATPQGNWTGPSAPDGVARVHAFRRIRDQDLAIVIGMSEDEALRTAITWTANAKLFAFGISVALLIMTALLVREVRAASGREQRLAQDRAVLEAAYSELESAKGSAEAKTAQIEATLSGMSDGVMMLDPDLRLVQWNARFAACTGVPDAMLRVGTPMAELLRGQAQAGEFGPVDVDAEVRRRIAALHTGRTTVLVERTRPDGSTLELRRSRLPGGGFVTLYTDITARKRAEDAQAEARRLAEEATEQKSRFVAIVSHEIRTPLNAVVNSLALLDQSGLSAAQRRLAETASQAGDALLELINDILELSKMEAGQLAVRPSVFELRALLDGVVEMFRAQAAERGIRLAIEMAPEVPAWLRADGGRLRQVMMNFVSNAAKFSLPGQVTLRAAAATVAGEPTLFLAVQDRGPRIADHEADLLFQPFSRLDNARASGTPGTGLGLAICERLTRLMGGQIGVRATRDGGNEFWITLPLETAQAVPSPIAAGGPILSLRQRRRSAVLLVEDIPANHLVTATMLRREGHRVDVAESGPEALRLVAERPYDLVFMDLIMPGMNGYEATRRIRALGGFVATIPIVALTANTAPEDRARCLAVGMNDMLGKPVRPQEMFEMVGRTVWHMNRAAIAQVPRTGTPTLDTTRLADLQRGLPAATLASLLEQCLADMARRMQKLREALTAGNTHDIEEIAHAVAGMAGTYGLAAIDQCMRKVMTAGRTADLLAARDAAQSMEADLETAAIAVREHVRALAA